MSATMRKNVIFAAVILAAALVLLALRPTESGAAATISFADGSTKSIPLNRDARYDLPTRSGLTVHLVVEDGAIRFVDSECPDHKCEAFGRLSTQDDWAACLPAGVAVLVE